MKLAVCPVYAIVYILMCSCFTGHGEDFGDRGKSFIGGLSNFMLGDDPTVNADGTPDSEGEAEDPLAPSPKSRHENACAKRSGKTSRICYNFPAAAEIKLHLHLRKHNELSYAYQAIANTFLRDEYALDGFSNYFQKQADRKLSDARKVYKYLIKRGGYINYYSIEKPKIAKIVSPLTAFNFALTGEQRIEKLLMDLRWYAGEKNDPHLMNFLDGMEEEQVDKVKELGDYITRVKRVLGDGLGVHILDRELRG